ncbi:MAG TPA: hypothetical protein VHX15_14440 [Frankiaceae bacterium]|jgi:dienelactone hydrolase|nr:hypothetical protein [Frankiaceae bacterium]
MTRFIEDDDFNDQFLRTLTAATRDSADLGEALAIAERIVPGDFASWAREWTRAAEQSVVDADTSLGVDDTVSARRAYLRAAEYYRQASFYSRTDLDDPILHSSYSGHVSAFRSALPLLGHPVIPMEIRHGDVLVRGYLFLPDDSGQARPTIIQPAGYDSTAESGYITAAASALAHGMNCLSFEGPGQGGVLYEDRVTMRPDYEVVLTPAIDWLLQQKGVDASQLILLGRSFAGYLAPRGAASDSRLAALICDPAQYDFGAGVRKQTGDEVWQRLQDHDPTLDDDLALFLLAEPHKANGFRWRMTAHGVSSLSDYLRHMTTFSLVGLADRITCPTLALAGEGDFANTGQLDVFADALTVPVTRHEFTIAEGAGGHCEGLGQERFDQYVYGWLARTLR